MVAIYLGSFVATIWVGWHDSIEQGREQAREARNFATIQQQTDEIRQSEQALSQQQITNRQLSQEIISLAGKNNELAERSIGIATGGNSFCWMTFAEPLDLQSRGGRPMFSVKGAYPIRNLQVIVTDGNKARQFFAGHPGSIQFDELATFSTIMDLGVLFGGGASIRNDHEIYFGNFQSQVFNVQFLAMNGAWSEILKMEKVGDHWSEAARVFKPGSGKTVTVLFEQHDTDFPFDIKIPSFWN